jgi:hypothetical protein
MNGEHKTLEKPSPQTCNIGGTSSSGFVKSFIMNGFTIKGDGFGGI